MDDLIKENGAGVHFILSSIFQTLDHLQDSLKMADFPVSYPLTDKFSGRSIQFLYYFVILNMPILCKIYAGPLSILSYDILKIYLLQLLNVIIFGGWRYTPKKWTLHRIMRVIWCKPSVFIGVYLHPSKKCYSYYLSFNSKRIISDFYLRQTLDADTWGRRYTSGFVSKVEMYRMN